MSRNTQFYEITEFQKYVFSNKKMTSTIVTNYIFGRTSTFVKDSILAVFNFSYIPQTKDDTDYITNDKLIEWIFSHDIEQSLRVLDIIMIRYEKPSSDVELELFADIKMETKVIMSIIECTKQNKRKQGSYWILPQWRVGNKILLFNDLRISLTRLQSKLYLLDILRKH